MKITQLLAKGFLVLACIWSPAWGQGMSADECRALVGSQHDDDEDDLRRAVADCILRTAKGLPPKSDRTPLRPNNAAALAFARKFAGKFKQEIPDGEPTVGTALGVTLKGAYVSTEYDPERQRLVVSHFDFRDVVFFDQCRSTGSFVGQNAFGVKRLVKTQSCERAVLKRAGNIRLALRATIKAVPPTLYREIKANGVAVEVDFTLAAARDGTVASREDRVDSATVTDPIESRMRLWTIEGQIQQVRLLLPGREPVVAYDD